MTRASNAQPGDVTDYGTTVDSVQDGHGGNHVVINTHDANGEQFKEIWGPDDEIDGRR